MLKNIMTKPLITAVIPTYKRPAFLKKAIQSVLGQTYPNVKVCIYDNASNDETLSIVSNLARNDHRIEYFSHETNIGALNNFYYGIERVETDFFSILCDDDYLLPNCYEMCLSEFEKCPEALFCCVGTVQKVIDRGVEFIPIMKWKEGVYSPPRGFIEIIKKGQPIWTGTLFRKDVIHDVGNVDLETSGHSDFDFDLRIAARGKYIIKQEVGAVYQQHSSNQTKNLVLSDIWPAFSKVVENAVQNEQLSSNTIEQAVKILRKRYRKKLLYIGLNALKARNYSETRKAADIFKTYFGDNVTRNILYAVTAIDKRISIFTFLIGYVSRIRWAVRRLLNAVLLVIKRSNLKGTNGKDLYK